MSFQCPSGNMIVGKNLQTGIMPKDTGVMNHCTEKDLWDTEDRRYKNSLKTKTPLQKLPHCTNLITKKTFTRPGNTHSETQNLIFKRMLDSNCHLQRSCEINI